MTPGPREPLSVPDAAERRRAIRAYTPEPVPEADLREIIRITSGAPSANNAQPWRFVIVRDAEVKARLFEVAEKQRQVASAGTIIVLYTDMLDTMNTVEETVHPNMTPERRAASAARFRARFGAMDEAVREDWGMGMGYIALGYLLLAAASLGYATSPMLGFDPDGVKALLGIPAHARIPAIVAIGHGAEEGFVRHRHAVDRILRFS